MAGEQTRKREKEREGERERERERKKSNRKNQATFMKQGLYLPIYLSILSILIYISAHLSVCLSTYLDAKALIFLQLRLHFFPHPLSFIHYLLLSERCAACPSLMSISLFYHPRLSHKVQYQEGFVQREQQKMA